MITTPNPTSMFTPSAGRRIFSSLFLLAAAAAAIGAIHSSRAVAQGSFRALGASASKIAPWVLEHTANRQQAQSFVVRADQAELSRAATLQTKTVKRRYVYTTLR